MSKKALMWNDVKKELNFTETEKEEMRLEMELIEKAIKVRKEAYLTQRELSEKSGVVQPSIAKIERGVRSPQTTTLIKLLYPMGYTLKVVPIKKKKFQVKRKSYKANF